MHDRSSPSFRWMLVWVALLFVVPANVYAQEDPQACRAGLDQADTLIAEGFFDEAIALLEPCRDQAALSIDEQARIVKLLADAYLAVRNLPEARAAIARLLTLDPDFTPDVNLDSQNFRDLVAQLRAEQATPAAPTGLNASPSADRIELTWAVVVEADIDRIRILRGTSAGALVPIDSVRAAATGYTDVGVEAGVTYHYAVQAVRPGGVASEPSGVVQATLATAPPLAESPEQPPQTREAPPAWRKWAFIGGGLVAGGIAAAVLLSGGGGDPGSTVLPGPPSVP